MSAIFTSDSLLPQLDECCTTTQAEDDDIVSFAISSPRNLETMWNILLARVTSVHRKQQLQMERQRSQDDAFGGKSDDTTADQNTQQKQQQQQPFPDPTAIQVPLTLGESVHVSLDLLKLVSSNSSKKNSSSTSQSTPPQLLAITSWVCEVTAEALRRNLRLEKGGSFVTTMMATMPVSSSVATTAQSPAICISGDQQEAILETELLHILTDSKLLSRREDAIDALQEFEEPPAVSLDEVSSDSDCQEDNNNDGGDRADQEMNEEDEEQKQQREEQAAQRLARRALREKQRAAQQAELDWKKRAALLARSLCKSRDWRYGVVAFADASAASPLTTTTTSPAAASPQQGSLFPGGRRGNNNNNNSSHDNDDDATDSDRVADWSTGLGVLAPLITGPTPENVTLLSILRQRNALVQQRAMRSFVSYWLNGLRRHAMHSVFATMCGLLSTAMSNPVVDAQQRLERQLEPVTAFKAVKKQQDLLLQQQQHQRSKTSHLKPYEPHQSRYSPTGQVWTATGAHGKKSATAVAAAANSDHKDEPQSQQEEHEQQEHKKKKKNEDQNDDTVSGDFSTWALTSTQILANLVSLKVLLSVLNTVMNNTLQRVAQQHRDDERRRLAFAWTRVPLSTLHSLSSDRLREVTNFPSDLEGLSVGFQRDILAVGTAVTRFVVALGAVAVTTAACDAAATSDDGGACSITGQADSIDAASSASIFSSSASFSQRALRACTFLLRTLIPIDTLRWWARGIASTFYATGASLVYGLRNLGTLRSRISQYSSFGEFFRVCVVDSTVNTVTNLLLSPRIRVGVFVIGVTALTSISGYLFTKLKKSRRVQSFLAQKADSVAVESGSVEYQAMRRRGKILLTPPEIIVNMRGMLRLQRHADARLMNDWYKQVDDAEAEQEDGKNKTKRNSASAASSSSQPSSFARAIAQHFSRFKSWLLRGSLVGDACFVLSQSALSSFFLSVSQLSDWIVPLAAAAVYQRLLSQRGVVSRFLILECLNSASGVVSAVQRLKSQLETVSLQAYKALIVQRICGDAEKRMQEVAEVAESPDLAQQQQQQQQQRSLVSSFVTSTFKAATHNAPDEATRKICEHLANRCEGSGDGGDESSSSLSVVVVAVGEQQNSNQQQQQHQGQVFRFAYPSRPDRVVLRLPRDKFCLPLRFRTLVAVIGKSGVGKSSLFRLLLREFEPRHTPAAASASATSTQQKAEQTLTLGLQLSSSSSSSSKSAASVTTSPLSNFAPAFLRSALFAFVPQTTELLPGSFNLAENISLHPCSAANPNPAVLARVRHALHLASADEVVASLPEGLFTKIGAGGSGDNDDDSSASGGGGGSYSGGGGRAATTILLSGGQIARVGIARALYHGSPVLLMDEPTSSLDRSNKMALLKTLRDLVEQQQQTPTTPKSEEGDTVPPLPPPRCVVYVTHDSDAIKAADHVVDLSAMLE